MHVWTNRPEAELAPLIYSKTTSRRANRQVAAGERCLHRVTGCNRAALHTGPPLLSLFAV